MPRLEIDSAPLPLNFPQDFLPDRSLLARLLDFAARSGGGTKVEIGQQTGIPTGKSTGKVEPMIHYARGMGLVSAARERGCWQLHLTGLGAVVYAEDRYLDETVTLWALHLLLCRRAWPSSPPAGIADPWFALFAEGGIRLGNPFERSAYLAFLTERHGQTSYLRRLSGLVPRSYIESSCLAATNALSVAGPDVYRRHPAPGLGAYFPAYTMALFFTWDALFPQEQQVGLDQLYRESGLLNVLGWNMAQAESWVAWMVNRGFLQLDRLTGGGVALRLRETGVVVRGLYDELA
jgi:hypothetical protein